MDTLLTRVQEMADTDTGHDADVRWMAIGMLARHTDASVVQTVDGWCRSAHPALRRLGAEVFGQIGCYEAVQIDCAPVLNRLQLLLHDSDPSVRASAAAAFGHHDVDRWDPIVLLSLVDDPEAEVRFSVASALGGRDCTRSDDAVRMLLRLMEDSDDDVRDWATFGLGISELDTPLVRDALAKRLGDPDLDTRCEALVGLAVRHDGRAVPVILAALEEGIVTSLVLEAITEMPRQAFLGPLQTLLLSNPDDQELEAAIAACRTA